jgi:hypothetical protein
MVELGKARSTNFVSFGEKELHYVRSGRLISQLTVGSDTDNVHIIATEGGGAGYQEMIGDCSTFSDEPSEEVLLHLKDKLLRPQTLFSLPWIIRPDPSDAQPNVPYLKVITDDTEECLLSYEYQTYLKEIVPYEPTNAVVCGKDLS